MRTTHHDRHRCAQNADHLTHNRPFSAFFAEVVCTLGTIPPQTVISPSPNGGNGVIRGTTRRRHAANQLLMLQNPHRRREGIRATGVPPDAGPDCGTCARRSRPRCRWAAAGPGRASTQRTEPHVSRPGAAGVEDAGGICRGAGGWRRGLAGLQGNAPSQTSAHQAPLVWRAPEGPAAVPVGGGGAWPGFEATRRAKLAARTSRGRAAAHRHTQRPGPPAPGTPVGPHSSTTTSTPNETRPRPVARPRPRHAHAAPFTTAPPAIRRSCPRGPRPRRGQPRGGRRGRGTGSRTRSRRPRCGRSGSTAGRHRAHHTRRA